MATQSVRLPTRIGQRYMHTDGGMYKITFSNDKWVAFLTPRRTHLWLAPATLVSEVQRGAFTPLISKGHVLKDRRGYQYEVLGVSGDVVTLLNNLGERCSASLYELLGQIRAGLLTLSEGEGKR